MFVCFALKVPLERSEARLAAYAAVALLGILLRLFVCLFVCLFRIKSLSVNHKRKCHFAWDVCRIFKPAVYIRRSAKDIDNSITFYLYWWSLQSSSCLSWFPEGLLNRLVVCTTLISIDQLPLYGKQTNYQVGNEMYINCLLSYVAGSIFGNTVWKQRVKARGYC